MLTHQDQVHKIRAAGVAFERAYRSASDSFRAWARLWVGHADPGTPEQMRLASFNQRKLWDDTWPHVRIACTQLEDILVSGGADPHIAEYLCRAGIAHQISTPTTVHEVLRIRILAGLRGKYKPMGGAWTRIGSHLSYPGGVADAVVQLLIRIHEMDPDTYYSLGLGDVGEIVNRVLSGLVRAPQDVSLYA